MSGLANVSFYEPIIRKDVLNEVKKLLDNCLYVEGWQACDVFSYAVKRPKEMIRRRSVKPTEMQIFRLIVAYKHRKPIGWLAIVRWKETDIGKKEIWEFVTPKYRGEKIARELSIIAGFNKRMYEMNTEERFGFTDDEIQSAQNKS